MSGRSFLIFSTIRISCQEYPLWATLYRHGRVTRTEIACTKCITPNRLRQGTSTPCYKDTEKGHPMLVASYDIVTRTNVDQESGRQPTYFTCFMLQLLPMRVVRLPLTSIVHTLLFKLDRMTFYACQRNCVEFSVILTPRLITTLLRTSKSRALCESVCDAITASCWAFIFRSPKVCLQRVCLQNYFI